MLLVQAIYKKRLQSEMKEVMQTSLELNSFVMESFSASETVKGYNAEKTMEDEMHKRFERFQNIKYKNEMSNSLQYHIVSTVRNVGDIFILGLLGLFTMSGKLTVGEMVKSYMYVSYIFAPTSYIMGLKSQLYNTSAALERLDDIFRTTTEEELDKKKKIYLQQLIQLNLKMFHLDMV